MPRIPLVRLLHLQEKKAKEAVPLNQVTAAFLLQQLQKETVLLRESIVDISLFGPGIMRATIQGIGKWMDPFSPGDMFNRCSTLLHVHSVLLVSFAVRSFDGKKKESKYSNDK